jgi:hypothetical protein
MMIYAFYSLLMISYVVNANSQPNNFNGISVLGRMEGPYERGVSRGWSANCYGQNVYDFSAESTDVHSGKFAQRMVCSSYKNGGVQLRYFGIQVEGGKYYTLFFWLKGTTKSRVYAGIRKNKMPYTSYVSNTVAVTNVWKPYIIIGKAAISDTSCGVYIMMVDTGEVVFDDVNIMEGSHRDVFASTLQSHKGNLIYNSGFEVGKSGWVPDDSFLLKQKGAKARNSYTEVGKAGIEAQPVPVTCGMLYTVSAYLRAFRPKTMARLRFFEWADKGTDRPQSRDEIDTSVALSMQWARYSVSGYVVPLFSSMYVFHLSCNDTVCLDNVQVEEGALTEYLPNKSIEIGVDTPTRWCLTGDTVRFTVRATAESKEKLSLHYQVTDLWNSVLDSGEQYVFPGDSDILGLTMEKTGIFQLKVQDVQSGSSSRAVLGVFPRHGDSTGRSDFLGTHFIATVPDTTNAFLASEAMGVGFVRLHDFSDFCHWYRVEPQKGSFVWHDAEIQMLRKRGFEIIANLGFAPLWASRKDAQMSAYQPGWTNALPRDTSEWKEYIAQVVQHYKTIIHYWEIWNEPYAKSFFDGSPEEYVRLLQLAYAVIKNIDSSAIVIGGCFSPHAEKWMQAVIMDHALSFMDAVSYHEYWDAAAVNVSPNDTVPVLVQHIRDLVALMKEYGEVKPLFMTEGGVRSPSFDPWVPHNAFPEDAHSAAATLVKGIAEMLSAGVSKVCYYFSGYGQGASPWYSTMVNGSTVLLDYAGRPKPTMMAYSALANTLCNAVPIASIRTEKFFCSFFRSTQSAETRGILWSTTSKLLNAEDAEFTDMMGNSLNAVYLAAEEPVFFRTQDTPFKYANYLKSIFSQ